MNLNMQERIINKRLTQHHLDIALKEHERIVELYKREYSRDEKRDWRTYEQRLARRIKLAAQELKPVIKEAYSMIKVSRNGRGAHPKTTVTDKVLMLLLKDIFKLSNRKMANMIAMFSVLSGIDVSYKTIERAYSDEFAVMTIHNAFMILVGRKGIKDADTSGDGTGYSMTVTRHYRNVREKELKRNNEKNEAEPKAKTGMKCYSHAFALMDLDTGMYIGYGTSTHSEHDAYAKAVMMVKSMGVKIKSIRLDKLYSYQSITDDFSNDTTIYLIPKSNATIKGSPAWRRIVKSFVENPFGHLSEYYLRNNSESGFSVDKRMCGWKVWQKLDDRVCTAMMCKGLWHNLMLID